MTQDDLRGWVRTKLSNHLGMCSIIEKVGKLTLVVPKHVFFVTEYPKTASGKIQKFVLQELGEKLVLKQESVDL